MMPKIPEIFSTVFRFRYLMLLPLTVIVFLCIGLSLYYIRTRSVERQFVVAASALLNDEQARPSHVIAVLPGSFGDAIAPYMSALLAVAKTPRDASPAETKIARGVWEGQRPLSDLPAEWQHALNEGRDAMRGALHATHAALALTPAGMRAINDGDHPPAYSEPHLAIYTAVLLAALDIRVLLQSNNIQEAVAECIDTQALGRDLSYNGVFGQHWGSMAREIVFHSCGAALDTADAEMKERALQQLNVIRNAIAPMSRAMKQERVLMETMFFGQLVDPSRLSQASPELRTLLGIERDQGRAQNWWDVDSLDDRILWIGFAEANQRMNVAWDLSRADRDRAYHDVFQNFPSDLIERTHLSDALSADDSYRASIATLEILRAATWVDLHRARRGSWPATLAEALPAGLTLTDPRSGMPLSLGRNGDSVQAVCTTPCGEASRKKELGWKLELVMHPDESHRR